MEYIQAAGRLNETGLAVCVSVLKRGEILCYPTETFYALGIDPWNESARNRLYALKGRAAEKQLPMVAANLEMVARICDVKDLRFLRLSQRFWPGPLTVVLPSVDHTGSYAVRVSSHPIAVQISAAFGGPIISTSANSSGEAAVSDPQKLSETLQQGIAVLVDGGTSPGGLPSTLVSLVEDPPRILREGEIPASEIFSAL